MKLPSNIARPRLHPSPSVPQGHVWGKQTNNKLFRADCDLAPGSQDLLATGYLSFRVFGGWRTSALSNVEYFTLPAKQRRTEGWLRSAWLLASETWWPSLKSFESVLQQYMALHEVKREFTRSFCSATARGLVLSNVFHISQTRRRLLTSSY